MLDKNFDQITPEDVTNLCRDGVYENQLLEFKRDLPAERNRPDPWLTGGDFTAYARDHLLREVIAFANAQGGTVIVGMDQIRDDPPRAAAVCPLPRRNRGPPRPQPWNSLQRQTPRWREMDSNPRSPVAGRGQAARNQIFRRTTRAEHKSGGIADRRPGSPDQRLLFAAFRGRTAELREDEALQHRLLAIGKL
jgi:hypothetical protein